MFLISLLISLFCVFFSIYFISVFFVFFYSLPITIKMKKNNLIIGNYVLSKTILFFSFSLFFFIVPLILVSFFLNDYLLSCLGGYLIGIIFHFLFFDNKKNKKIIIDNYILDFKRYFNKEKYNEISLFFENYLERDFKIFKKINIKHNDIFVALTLSVVSGDLNKVKELIAGVDDFNINMQCDDEGGGTLLMIASFKGRLDIVKELIKAGADVNIQNNYGDTALMDASHYGNIDIAKELIKAGADVQIQNNHDIAALTIASQEGHVDIVKELIKAGADIDIQDNYFGATALMNASCGGHLHAVKELIKAGANVNIQDKNYCTALMAASLKGYLDVVKELIKAGADVNIKNKYGYTASAIALKEKYLDIAKELMAVEACDHN